MRRARQYFLAAAALCGGRVRVPGLGAHSLQGDVRFVDLLEQMGATVLRGEDFLDVHGSAQLDGIEADMNAISDTAPTLAALAPFARRPVVIRTSPTSACRRVTACTPWRRNSSGWASACGNSTMACGLNPRTSTRRWSRRIMTTASPWPSPSSACACRGSPFRDPQCVRKTFPDFFARLEALRR